MLALQAPHAADEGPIYPGTCRPNPQAGIPSQASKAPAASKLNWRFRVPDGETIEFVDGFFGRQQFVAGKDFGDFVVWRHDDVPSYQLSVVVDDAAMRITEVVRGADLLLSTARQLLLYRALGYSPPAFYHCPLVTDERGRPFGQTPRFPEPADFAAAGHDSGNGPEEGPQALNQSSVEPASAPSSRPARRAVSRGVSPPNRSTISWGVS